MPRLLPSLSLLLFASVACAHPLEATPSPLELGSVSGEAPVERVVTVRNPGPAAVQIRNVQLTPPLTIARMKALVPADGSIDLVVRLGTPRPVGHYEGQIAIGFADENLDPLVVDVNATLVPDLEFLPRRELVAVAETGSEARDAVEIVNHRPTPLSITGIEVSGDGFTAALETLEAGRRYRIVLTLPGSGKTGRRSGAVTLRTDAPDQPELRVPVRVMVIDRVHTFPEHLDFGRLAIASLGPEQLQRLASSVMVYQKDGSDFQVKVSTDVPFLRLRPEKSTKFGDRWQVFYEIDREKLVPGSIRGSIRFETNDEKVPRLSMPVEAIVE